MKRFVLFSILAGLALLFAGCSQDDTDTSGLPTAPSSGTEKVLDYISQNGRTAPAGLVTVAVNGTDVTCWPFTGSSFDGMGVDPVNLVFTGNADPMQIREALLALDGDRSVLGLPPVYPFDQTWHDALGGGVQTSYDADGGWLGSVIQLTLGNYEPVRFHLRLFRTGAVGADGLPITLGAAHFEVLIPGTSEHQVLSWEVAEQIVTGDLMRSGLLDPSQHIGQTGQINPAPSWRTIDPAIYNGLPAELVYLIDGPPQPQENPVPIGTDGHATTIHLMGARPVQPMTATLSADVEFGQYIPRPFCSTGPGDWLHITGGVTFTTTVTVDAAGRYEYEGGYTGMIYAVPLDIVAGIPVGEPFSADVRGSQHGWLSGFASKVFATDRKLTHEAGGTQMEDISFRVTDVGECSYRAKVRCLDAD